MIWDLNKEQEPANGSLQRTFQAKETSIKVLSRPQKESLLGRRQWGRLGRVPGASETRASE